MSKLEKVGTFKAKALRFKTDPSSGGTPRVSVEFSVTEGPEAGSTIWWDGWLTDKAQERTCESLMHCGWTGADFETLPGLGTQDVELVCEEEEYQGKKTVKVKWVNDPGRVRQTEGASLASYADRMQALALGLKNKAPKPNAPIPTGPDAKPLW